MLGDSLRVTSIGPVSTSQSLSRMNARKCESRQPTSSVGTSALMCSPNAWWRAARVPVGSGRIRPTRSVST